MPAVMQPRLLVVVLARKPEVDGGEGAVLVRVLVGDRVIEGIVLSTPDSSIGAVGGPLGRAEVIKMQVGYPVGRAAVDLCDRSVIGPDVGADGVPAMVIKA
jgi:hypothetical protein